MTPEEYIAMVEEENRKLKKECEENDYLVEDNARWMKRCAEKTMEIKKLNIKVASLEWEIKWLNYTIDKLKEENQTLELWLDNKEKLNEEYRKQIDKYKRQYEHSMWEDDELIYEEWLYD